MDCNIAPRQAGKLNAPESGVRGIGFGGHRRCGACRQESDDQVLLFVASPRVSRKVEGKFDLPLCFSGWFVGGHENFPFGITLYPEPGAISRCSTVPANLGVGDGAGHADTQALLHRHRVLHV